MLSMLNRGGNIITQAVYNPFVRRDLNYGFSHGSHRDRANPYWTNNFAKGFDLKKRLVEQPQLLVFKQTRHWDSWVNEGKQNELVSSQFNWWLILGIISGAVGLWSFMEAKAQEKDDEDKKHVKLNEKNYQKVIIRLKNNDPKLLSIEMEAQLNERQLRVLCEAIKDNTTIGHVIWHKDQIQFNFIGLVNNKLKENNKNYRFFPNDHVYSLLSDHAYISSKAGDKVLLSGEHKDKEVYVQDWIVHSVDDNTNKSGYYAVACRNDKTRQIVLAFRGTESLIEKLLERDSDMRTNIEGILGSKIVEQQKLAYCSTQEIVKWAKQNGYSFSVTGHSLGAWLAELSAYYCHRSFSYSTVRAVTFDSPGSLPMFKKLQSNVRSYGNVLELKDIDIVTYLSAPNVINSCNTHVGSRVYRVFADLRSEEGQLYQTGGKIPFIGNEVKNNIAAMSTFTGHSLVYLINSFDPHTGKPREYHQILDWPHIAYKKESSFISDAIKTMVPLPPMVSNFLIDQISSYTLASIVDVLADIVRGNVLAEQYHEYFKHAEHKGGYKIRESLIDKEKFDLMYVGHYGGSPADDSRDTIILKEGTIDWYLYELKIREENLKRSTLPIELKELVDSYKIVRDENNKYYIEVTDRSIDIDILKQRMRRFLAVIPKSKDIFKFFLLNSTQAKSLVGIGKLIKQFLVTYR